MPLRAAQTLRVVVALARVTLPSASLGLVCRRLPDDESGCLNKL
jgi:hypothetical protein